MHRIRDEYILDIYGVCVDTDISNPIYCIILPYMENGSIRGLVSAELQIQYENIIII